LARALVFRPREARGVEAARVREQPVEHLDGFHRTPGGAEHEAHVEEHHRVRHELVGALELGERALVVLLVEEAEASIEPLARLGADGVGRLRTRAGSREQRGE